MSPGAGLTSTSERKSTPLIDRESICHVRSDREVWEQGPVLKNETNTATLRWYMNRTIGDNSIANSDLAIVDSLEACKRTQQGGLAAAAGAKDSHLRAGRGSKVRGA